MHIFQERLKSNKNGTNASEMYFSGISDWYSEDRI